MKLDFCPVFTSNTESASNSALNDASFIKVREKKVFDGPGVPYRSQCAVKNESRLSTAKVTSFYSEFNADFKYLILFKKYRGQKNSALPPLVH